MQPINEFLLWNSCNNNCAFCHQKANREKYPGKFPDDAGKLKSIRLVVDFLERGGTADGSHILFMGGELFDTRLSETTEKEFLRLADIVAERMVSGKTGFLYLNSNLIYRDRALLYSFLDTFTARGLGSRIRFTTSYDIAYRYRNDQDRRMVEDNMIRVHTDYPEMPKVANCIMTDKACHFLLDDTAFPARFMRRFGFELNPIPYIRLHRYMSPDRKDVLSLLSRMDDVYPGYLKRYVKNLAVRQERILWEFNGKELSYASSKDAVCGHNENFRRVYADDDRCFVCDCIKTFNVLGSKDLRLT